MVKFYTNVTEITPENRRRVFPMLFDWFFIGNPQIREHFELVDDPKEANVFILPIDAGYYLESNNKHLMDEFIKLAQFNNSNIWLYSAGDFGITFSSPLTVFRLGGFHSRMNENNHVMPCFVNDPYQSLISEQWKPKEKEGKPCVGFVGNADGSIGKWMKEFVIYTKQEFKRFLKIDFSDRQSFFPSSIIRFKYLESLRQSDLIASDFIYRKKYRGGVTNDLEKLQTSLEFYDNINSNLYTFCLRGSGNFSVRFYETLMMGRIPILFDTDVRLPFHDQIDWKNHCVFASQKNYIEELLHFHNTHSVKELCNIQFNNRKLALEKLNRINYFIEMSKIL